MISPSRVRGGQTADGKPIGYGFIVKAFLILMVPLALSVATFAVAWWYVVIYNAPATISAAPPQAAPASMPSPKAESDGNSQALGVVADKPEELGLPAENPPAGEEEPQELGTAVSPLEATPPLQPGQSLDAPPQEMTALTAPAAAAASKVPQHFYSWFCAFALLAAIALVVYYRRMDGEQFEILKELVSSVVPLGVLTAIVLAVILFGITTATESAAIGALGALYLAAMAKFSPSGGLVESGRRGHRRRFGFTPR